ncbi:hypothetical protein RHMOL_Rhmol01G0176900 [Rhododendron molle]|uniref:Uncharacterized protein n=1 Tax=Rhododendron molle TaxID=49168 RepID=A0ACC0Q424_RHOML|nr:hypothetical protein RHMOL_Rhmol01G0176900 [Rhododendron molle]
MTNPKSTGKEFVLVAYATNARPLAMIDPPKQMRQKKSPRKQTMDPSSINSEDKSEVVRSSSPSPGKKEAAKKRKASEVAAVDATDKTSSPTPMKKVTPTKTKKLNTVKIKITDHGKKPETEKVYERKRKRPNREYEGVIDLQTPTKRVTRSSEALQKMQRGNDSEEKKIDKRKEKGDEEEEEWNEEEGDEEEKGKGKKEHKSKGFKGKEVKGKQEKKEPGMSNNPQNVVRHIQYRSTLNTVLKLIKSIHTGEFTPLQMQEIKKTPFADLVFGIVKANLDEAYVRKSDTEVLKLVQQYEGTGGRFKLGGKSVKITAKEVTLIFGIQSGTTWIVLNPTPRVPKSDFAERLCPGPKGQRILTIRVLREFFDKAIQGTTLEDAKDLARVLCLLLIGTLFVLNTQARVSWVYLDFIEPLENSTLYNWSSFITEELIHELNLRGFSNPTKVRGCVMGLMVFSSELEPNGEEEELYRFSPVPEHEADGKASNLKTAVDNSGDEVVEDTSDEETDSEQDEVVNLRGIIRKLSEENAEKDRIISDLRRENKDKNATISELRRRIAKHTQTTTPEFGFEGISAQFDKDHLEHENVTLHSEIGGMLTEKDIIEEKLEVAGDIIDDFVTHSVTQTYQAGEDLGEKESKDNEDHARGDKQEIEKEVEEEEEEEEEEGEEREEEGGGGGGGEGEEKGGDANLLHQIVDCSDADICCTVWTNDVTREVVPLEDIMKLLVDCEVIVCMIMDMLRHLEPIPKTLLKIEIDQFRAGLVSPFLNDEGRSWTIKKWEARRMGKGSR